MRLQTDTGLKVSNRGDSTPDQPASVCATQRSFGHERKRPCAYDTTKGSAVCMVGRVFRGDMLWSPAFDGLCVTSPKKYDAPHHHQRGDWSCKSASILALGKWSKEADACQLCTLAAVCVLT
jgi:hypothetical protein